MSPFQLSYRQMKYACEMSGNSFKSKAIKRKTRFPQPLYYIKDSQTDKVAMQRKTSWKVIYVFFPFKISQKDASMPSKSSSDHYNLDEIHLQTSIHDFRGQLGNKSLKQGFITRGVTTSVIVSPAVVG